MNIYLSLSAYHPFFTVDDAYYQLAYKQLEMTEEEYESYKEYERLHEEWQGKLRALWLEHI